jgi:hypothetical protein
MALHGCHQTTLTPGIFKHVTRRIICSLVVDDVGAHCVGHENSQHLINTLQATYDFSIDLSGSLNCGIPLKWDYNINTPLDLSIASKQR